VAVLAAAGCGTGSHEPTVEAPVDDARLQMKAIEPDLVDHISTLCHLPTVTPIVECVEELGPDKFVAHFGYDNTTTATVQVPIGKHNRFVPKPKDRGQPTDFLAGTHHDVFSVPFDGKPLAWLLTAKHAIATKASPACHPQMKCPDSCDDGNPCTVDTCDAATQFKCVHTPSSDGTSCADDTVCDGAEACKAGVCMPGTPLQCDDNNPCTDDSCDPKKGCEHKNAQNGTSCTAPGACNGAGMCKDSTCEASSGPSCDDHNPCTADSCDASGKCVHVPVSDGTSCSDGNACNGAETCQAGVCKSGPPPVCNSNNPCTVGSCVPATGCVLTPVADGTTCPSTNCGTAACKQGMCMATSGPNCDDGNPCTADSCGPNGTCVHTPVANGTSCSDMNACNGLETCQAGQCHPGTPVTCTAVDACHGAGTCDPATGMCSKPVVPDGSACSAGNKCTSGDACKSGVCIAGTVKTCTASDKCHSAGTCDAATGTCSNPPVTDGTSCSDGNACNGAETCKAGTCTPGMPLQCNTTNPCVASSCDPSTGCKSTPVADGTVCAPASSCAAASTCSAGVCKPGAGLNCDDHNPCTADSCGTSGCVHTPVTDGTSCSDGNLCNGAETCKAGVCSPGTPVACKASDQCHVAGTCNPATGQCSNPAATDGTACSDGNKCTSGEVCKAGACGGGTPVTCTASDQCHVAGTCNPATGTCSNPNAPDGASCGDGNACHTGDLCKAGVCTVGSTVTCSVQDQCHTAGTCNPSTGQCSNPVAADGTACTDPNKCLSATACAAGVCKGTAKTCTASDQCHVAGTCDPTSGSCSNPNAPDGTACKGGNACTVGDACKAGACASGTPLVCVAPPGCTPGTCNPANGMCSAPVCAAMCPSRVWNVAYDTPLVGGEALDSTGALYITGGLASSIDFGNGPLTTAGSSDVYMAKIDPATGKAVWSFRAGDEVDQVGVNVAADNAGHVALIGTYIGGLAFGGAAPPLTAATDSVFVAGFNSATGAALWAKDVSLGGGALLGIAIDPSDGNVVVTGYAGVGVGANFGSGALTSGGGKDVVVAKYNTATGALVWAKQFGGTLDQVANAVAVDATGRVFLTGQYSGALDFGSGPLPPTTTSASKKIFVARLDGKTGSGQVAKGYGVSGQQNAVAIAVDGMGNVIVGGSITGNTVDFGTGALVSAGGQDAFAAKLSGDLVAAWAERFGDATTQNTKGVAVDSSGNVILAGLFQGVMDFTPAATLTAAGAFDAFVATLDAATGAPKCATAAGDAADQGVARVVVDATGAQYLLGTFVSSITWDGGGTLTGSPTATQTFLVKRK